MSTPALTANGVQYGTVTIGSGQTSATSTITAVGAGAFIVFMGQNYSASTTDPTVSLGRIELTNSTTVTGYRHSSDTNTLTLNFCVIDGDTTNLIASVQSGIVAIGSGTNTGTQTISAVNNNNAVVHYLGCTTDLNNTDLHGFQCRLTLAGTTVTATRLGGLPTHNPTIGFIVIEFQGAALNSATQQVVQSATSGTTVNTTITSVTANNSCIFPGGSSSNTLSNNNAFMGYCKLTNGTTFTGVTAADPGGGTRYIVGTVVEFVPGLLTSAVRRGTIALSGASSGTLTISGVTTSQAMTIWLGNTTNQTTTNEQLEWSQCALTNGTTVTMQNSANVTSTGSVEVIEFNTVSAGPPGPSGSTWFSLSGL